MAAASVSSGTPVGVVARSRARRSSRKVMRATMATATEPNRSVRAAVGCRRRCRRRPRRAGAGRWASSRAMRSRTSSARKSSKSAKCRCSTPLAQPASVVTARLVSASGRRGAGCARRRRTAVRAGRGGLLRSAPRDSPYCSVAGCAVDEWACAHLKWARAHSIGIQPGAASPGGGVVRHQRRAVRPGPAPLPRAMVDRILAAARAGTCWTSAAAPASRPGCSRRPAAQVLGVDPDARMAGPRPARGLEVEVAPDRGLGPGGPRSSTRSWPGRPGTGWTRWPGPARAAQALRPGRAAGRVLERFPAPRRPGRSHGRGHGPGGAGRADAGAARAGWIRAAG